MPFVGDTFTSLYEWLTDQQRNKKVIDSRLDAELDGIAQGLSEVAARVTLSQPLDPELSAIAGLTSAADKGIQFTGSGTAATYDLTTAGKALLDDANAAAQRTTLALGGAAVLNVGTTAGTVAAGDHTHSFGMVLLTSGVVGDGAATLDIPLTSYTSYSAIVIQLENVVPATDNVALNMRFSTDGGSTYETGASDYGWGYNVSAATPFVQDAADSEITIAEDIGNVSTEGASFKVELIKPFLTTHHTRAIWLGYAAGNAGDANVFSGAGARLATQDTDAVRFLWSSGNFAASVPGTYRVYGIT